MATVPTLQESQTIVRERNFPVSNEMMILVRGLLDRMDLRRSTGMLCIDLNQGGVGSMRFREEKKIENSLDTG